MERKAREVGRGGEGGAWRGRCVGRRGRGAEVVRESGNAMAIGGILGYCMLISINFVVFVFECSCNIF